MNDLSKFSEKCITEFEVNQKNAVDLAKFNTDQNGGMGDKQLKRLREQIYKELAQWQERLYAESKQSLLIVLQAMDAAGKDSTIAKLTSGLNAQGCKVVSFKKPSKQEMAHDFLWRVHQHAPEQGDISIFNRSHYEDVLVVKVHGWASEEKITQRYQHINNFESLLADRGTKVIKIMLHMSPEYQLSRFQNRLNDPEKAWKFNPGDLDERQLWDDYMSAFSDVLQKCTTPQAPWYVVPAQNRRFRDVLIGAIVLQTLKQMAPNYPEADFDRSQFSADTIR